MFQLGTGNFGESGYNTVEVNDVRCSASISNAGGPGMASAHVRIQGLTADLMNELSTLGQPIAQIRRNNLFIKAGKNDETLGLVYQGVIQSAWFNQASAPDGSFEVESAAGYFEAIKPITPSSYSGPVDAAQIMKTLATEIGCGVRE